MKRGFVSVIGLGLLCAPAFVVAQQSPPPPPVAPATGELPPVLMAPETPAETPVSDVRAPTLPVTPTPPGPSTPEVNVTIGGTKGASSSITPLPKVELPEGMAVPAPTPKVTATVPLVPPRPMPAAPPAKLTPAQIAQQIAPNFNVTRDYVRLTQCYGIADFMGAVTRIQASRPGATPQIVGVARSIGGLQDAMQPMVLAASTVRGEARFRSDYDAIARNGQRELATSRTPNVTMQRRLATLDACRADVVRWRGGR
jgi:hypothetical protein